MADYQRHHNQQQHQQPRSHQVVKAATAATTGGLLLFLSGLTLVGTVIALTVATPLLVIFSPVLVPAAITVALIIGGFLASGGFGLAGLSVVAWIYRFVTGKKVVGMEQLEQMRTRLGSTAREARDKAEQFGKQSLGAGQ